MPRDESTYAQDWLNIARRDLSRAETLLAAGDPEAAGFFLQQGVEKYLKAFLLSKGWRLKRIHDLEVLLNDALVYEPSLEGFRSLCQKTTAFYLVERYPFSMPTGIEAEDVRQSLVEASKLANALEGYIA